MWNPLRKIETIIRWLLLGLVALVPVFFLLTTAPGDVLATNKQGLIYSVVIIALALWLVAIVRRGKLSIRLSGLELGIAIWLAVWLLGAVFSLDPLRSLTTEAGFLTLGALALMSLVFVNFFESRDIPEIINWFLFGSLVAIGCGLLALLGLPVFGWVGWLAANLTVGSQFNTIGSFNLLGSLSVLVLVLALAKHFSLGNKFDQRWAGVWKIVSILTVIVAALMIVLVNWWGHYLLLALGMLAIITAPSLTQKLARVEIRLGAANIVVPMAVLIAALLLAGASSYFAFRLPWSDRLPLEVSLTQRSSLAIAYASFKDRPVFGYGAGNFQLAYDKYKPADINQTPFWSVRFNNAASEIWQTVVIGGLLGLAAWLALAFFLARGMLAGLRRGIQQREIYGLAVFPLMVVGLSLALFSPLSNIVLLFSFWLMVALVGLVKMTNNSDQSAAEATDGEASITPSDLVGNKHLAVNLDSSSLLAVLTALGLVMVLILGLAGGYLLFRKYQSEYFFAQAGRVKISTLAAADAASMLLAKSAQAGGRETGYLNGFGQLMLSEIGSELNNKVDKPDKVAAHLQSLTQNLIAATTRLITDYKHDATAWSNAGFFYQNLMGIVSGADQAAISAYQEALKRAPNDPLIHTRIGLIYLARADNNRGALAEVDRQKKTVSNRAALEQQIVTDYKSAEASFKRAVELKSDYASVLYDLGLVYERENRLKDAIKQLELSRAVDFQNANLAFELGLLYYRDNQKQNAFNEMSRAVGLFKDFSNARWYLALMLEEHGQINDALVQLNEILKLPANRDNTAVQEKIAQLEAGKREFPPGKITSKKPIEAKVPGQK